MSLKRFPLTITLIALLADVSLVGVSVALGYPELGCVGLAYWILAVLCWGSRGFSTDPQWSALFLALSVAQASLLSAGIVGELTAEFRSDSWYYDLVAREIAARVSVWEQISPFAWGYIWEVGIELGGEIASFGFYKLLGVMYTGFLAIGVEPSVFALSVTNTGALGVTGYALGRVLLNRYGSGWRLQWGLWALFMLNPYLLEQVTQLRKDLLVLAIFAVGVGALARGRGRSLLTCTLALASLRWVQACALAVGVLLDRCWRRRHLAWLARSTWLGGTLVVGGLSVVAGSALVQLDMAPEVAQAFLADLDSASFGLSEHLQDSVWGAVVYAWLYPFPSLSRISEAGALLRSWFSMLWGAVTAVVLAGILAGHARHVRTCEVDRLQAAVEWMYVLWFVALLSASILSMRTFGFVIMEARYKLPWYFLAAVWIGVVWRGRIQTRAAAVHRS